MYRILIVEDESIVALNLQHTLVRLGYDVVGMAGSSGEAIDIAEAEHPDLILMDINLGGGNDGIETAARLGSQRRTAVVYLTAYSEDSTLQRARETAPYGYLLKPFSERELHATIQMALERYRSDAAIAEREERLRLALQAAEMGTWDLNTGSGRLQSHGLPDRMPGIEAQTFGGTCVALLERVAPEDHAAVSEALAKAVDCNGFVSIDFRGLYADGSKPWLRLQARSHVRAGAPARLVGVVQDISVQRQSELAMRQAATVFSSTREALFVTDAQLQLVAVNHAFSEITGYAAVDVIGRCIGEWLLRAPRGQGTLDLACELKLKRHWQGELIGTRQEGESFPVWLSATLVPGDDGGAPQVVGMFSDIGALRRADEQLLHLAHHDSLTGLPNRLLAIDRLNQAISRARRHRWRIAVVMVDLDHFKRINDTLGHSAGDELLCVVASRLKAGLRVEDTVARLGGDEFILILENIDTEAAIGGAIAKVLERVGEPVTLSGCEVRPCASMGIAMFPDHAEDRDTLLRAADAAMYVAKNSGRHRLAFFAPAVTETKPSHPVAP